MNWHRKSNQVRGIVLFIFFLSILVGPLAMTSTARADEATDPQLQPALDICTSTVRIMPLGDSITRGSGSEVTDVTKMIAYRKDLWDSLQAAGYNVDFVGSQTNGTFYSGFDPDHEGHGGWPAQDIRDNIYGSGGNWLQNTPADIILLHIGANDISVNQPPQEIVTEVGQILDKVDQYETDKSKQVTVILAQIINRLPYSQATSDFNNLLAQLVQARQNIGPKIILVNMETEAGIIYAVQPAGDMYDNGNNILHPFHTGYTKMAAVWKQAIESLYQVCNDAPVVNDPGDQSTTELDQVNLQIQASDPDAGDALAYSAEGLPSGLSINSTSGLISGSVPLGASQGSPYAVKVTVTDNGNPQRSSDIAFSWVVQPRRDVYIPLILFRRN